MLFEHGALSAVKMPANWHLLDPWLMMLWGRLNVGLGAAVVSSGKASEATPPNSTPRNAQQGPVH